MMDKLSILIIAVFLLSCGGPQLQRADNTIGDVEDRTSSLKHITDGNSEVESFSVKEVTRSSKSNLLGTAFTQPVDNVIYFGFDSSNIESDSLVLIEAHAAYLETKPNTNVTLSGHADERGSREYNLALGEQRANVIKRQLVLLGVSESQLRTVSYGEEKPAVNEHHEAAWNQNRRVEITY